MWIRTQNKEDLIKCQKISIIGPGKDVYLLVELTNDNYIELGIYKSKERALEVLDEIDSKTMMNKVIEIYSNLGDLTFANRENYSYTPIYQMPKE